MHAQRRQGVVYTLNLFQLFNQSPASKYPPHLPLAQPNPLSRRTVTNTRTDGHTSPLQIIMHLLIRLERFETFFYGRMISFLLASWIIIFLGVLLTWNKDIPVDCKKMTYKSYFKPTLTYASETWTMIKKDKSTVCAQSLYTPILKN